MRLAIFVLTVGEEATFATLESIKKFTPETTYSLTIWYDACGREYNAAFVERLRTYTKDVIVSFENQGAVAAMGYFLLYKKADYLILSASDTPPKKGYIEKLMAPFTLFDDVVVTGEPNRELPEPFQVNGEDLDGVSMFDARMLDKIGSFCPSFHNIGPFYSELLRRIRMAGLKYVAVAGVSEHLGHEGREKLENLDQMLDQDCRVLLKSQHHTPSEGYNWWTKHLMEIPCEKELV